MIPNMMVGFFGMSTIVGYLMPNPLYTYILNIYDLVWLGVIAYRMCLFLIFIKASRRRGFLQCSFPIHPNRLFPLKVSIVNYLMPNPLNTYVLDV